VLSMAESCLVVRDSCFAQVRRRAQCRHEVHTSPWPGIDRFHRSILSARISFSAVGIKSGTDCTPHSEPVSIKLQHRILCKMGVLYQLV